MAAAIQSESATTFIPVCCVSCGRSAEETSFSRNQKLKKEGYGVRSWIDAFLEISHKWN
jgi:hypothetical protein